MKCKGIIVVSGPSDPMTSIFVDKILQKYPDGFDMPTAHTTRLPAFGEENGREYFFITYQTFEEMLHENAFVEYTRIQGTWYGTTISEVKAILESGKVCLRTAQMEHVRSIKSFHPETYLLLLHTKRVDTGDEEVSAAGRLDLELPAEDRLQSRTDLNEIVDRFGPFDEIISNEDDQAAWETFEEFCVKQWRRRK